MTTANSKLKRTEDPEYEEFVEDYAPKRYSLRENVAMGGKLFLVIGLLLGLLCLLNAIAAK